MGYSDSSSESRALLDSSLGDYRVLGDSLREESSNSPIAVMLFA